MGPPLPLSPRMESWLASLPLQPEHRKQLGLVLADNAYTSLDILAEENVEKLVSLLEVYSVKPGSIIALRKRLAELKVASLHCVRDANETLS